MAAIDSSQTHTRPGDAGWRSTLSPATIGILAFIAAVSCGGVHSGISKALTLTVGAFLIVWGRYVGTLAFLLPITVAKYGWRALLPTEPGIHILRGMLILGASLTYILALRGMPLADASALAFVYPFIVTALSPIFLKEAVRPSNWIAVTTGFVGILFVVRPTFESVDYHALLALEAGACFALTLLLTRTMAVSAPALVMTTSTSLIGTLALSCALPWIWQDLDAMTIGIFILIGVFSALSQSLNTYACTQTPMPILAPFAYMELVVAIALGFLMFGDLPDLLSWTGITIIIASGVFIAMNGRTKSAGRNRRRHAGERSDDDHNDHIILAPGLRIY